MLINILMYGIFAVSTSMAILFFFYAIKVLRGNKSEYDLNRARTSTIWRAILGEVSVTYKGSRDHRVAAGIAMDLRSETPKVIHQGRLSEESVNSALFK